MDMPHAPLIASHKKRNWESYRRLLILAVTHSLAATPVPMELSRRVKTKHGPGVLFLIH
jgi:hypothetical protein